MKDFQTPTGVVVGVNHGEAVGHPYVALYLTNLRGNSTMTVMDPETARAIAHALAPETLPFLTSEEVSDFEMAQAYAQVPESDRPVKSNYYDDDIDLPEYINMDGPTECDIYTVADHLGFERGYDAAVKDFRDGLWADEMGDAVGIDG
jgi:hypothetical protein